MKASKKSKVCINKKNRLEQNSNRKKKKTFKPKRKAQDESFLESSNSTDFSPSPISQFNLTDYCLSLQGLIPQKSKKKFNFVLESYLYNQRNLLKFEEIVEIRSLIKFYHERIESSKIEKNIQFGNRSNIIVNLSDLAKKSLCKNVTFYISLHIFDSFISKVGKFKNINYELCSLASFLIAYKFNEIHYPDHNLIIGEHYTRRDLAEAECAVLKVIEHKICSATPIEVFRFINKKIFLFISSKKYKCSAKFKNSLINYISSNEFAFQILRNLDLLCMNSSFFNQNQFKIILCLIYLTLNTKFFPKKFIYTKIFDLVLLNSEKDFEELFKKTEIHYLFICFLKEDFLKIMSFSKLTKQMLFVAQYYTYFDEVDEDVDTKCQFSIEY